MSVDLLPATSAVRSHGYEWEIGIQEKALTLTPAHAIPFEQKLAEWREILRFLGAEL